MDKLVHTLDTADFLALGIFSLAWLLFEITTDYSRFSAKSLTGLMAEKRRQWMLVLADRELRMVDTQIMSGLQQGAAFFASTSILAIGACFALLGSTDTVLQIYQDLPLEKEFSRTAWEVKSLGLALLFAYTFFKFGWSYRLFNYASILIGAVPSVGDTDVKTRRAEAMKAAEMNVIAGRHFTAGLRGIFFALGYLGWFVSPWLMIISTIFVLMVLIRRQYFSHARRVLLD